MDVRERRLLQWHATSSKFPSLGTSPRTQYSLQSPGANRNSAAVLYSHMGLKIQDLCSGTAVLLLDEFHILHAYIVTD